jgi:large subunit ribosomal protein L31e
MANLERIYTIPLRDAFDHVRTKRGKRAVNLIRAFALRHMKADDVRVSEGVNSAILRDGIEKPPRRIKVRMVKGDDALVRVWLIGEEEKIKEIADKKKKETEDKKKTEEAAKKATEAKKEEAKKAADAKTASAKPAPAPAQAAKPAAPAAKAAAPAPSAAKPK